MPPKKKGGKKKKVRMGDFGVYPRSTGSERALDELGISGANME
jgi:hypothetical protein